MAANPALVVATQRGWQAAAGLLTSLLILHFLSAAQQGWYYSFVSMAAFFTLFDMGLSLILIQRSAGLFTGLQPAGRGRVQGSNAAAFAQLAAYAQWWYSRAAAAFLVLLLPLGLWFFSSVNAREAANALTTEDWPWLWAALLAATAINLWLLPFLSLVEGAGEISAIYTLRLAQGVAGSLLTWLLLAAGAGVWACLGVPAATAAIGLAWLFWRRDGLYETAARQAGQRLDWRAAIWPQQWRLAVGWISGYLLAQIYVPLLLRTQGPEPAGQLGVTLTFANALALVSQSWLTQGYPEMSARAARHDWHGLVQVFGRALRRYAALFAAGTAVFLLVLAAAWHTPYVHRLLPLPALLMLFGATFLSQLATAMATGLRAAGLEPFAWVTATGAGLTLALGLPLLQQFGVEGLAAAMLAVQALFVVPATLWVWKLRLDSWK